MNKDKVRIIIVVVLLCIYGLLMVYSASYVWAEYKFNNPYKFLESQLLFFIVGLILMVIISKIDIIKYRKYIKYLLLFCFILLCLVLIPGVGKVRNGSRSWFGIGSLGVQPSEFSKIALIMFVADYLDRNDRNIKSIFKGLFPLFLVILVFSGLIMLEPDFGTCMIVLITLFGIIFIAGPNISLFIKVGLIGLLGIVILIAIAPYRLARIVSYLNPWTDPLGSGFQIIQSLYAIGPSGLLGTGLGKSIQKNFYLPEPQTDFIFSIIAEELGFIGSFLVIGLFFVFFTTTIKIALKEEDLFKKYLIFGLSIGITFQAILNLSVVTGIIPTTGVTLPFISYGGSSLLVSMISVGIILSITQNSK